MWRLAILFLALVICNFADGAPTAPDPPLAWPLPTSRSVDFTISHSHHCYTMMLMKENSSIHHMKHEDSATSSKHRHHCARAVQPIIQFIKNNPDYISKASVLCPDLRATFKPKNLYMGVTKVRNYALPDETNMIPYSASANTEATEISTHFVQRAKREVLEAEHVGKFNPNQPDASNLYARYIWGGRKKRESPSPDQPDDANLYAGYVWGGRKKRESPSPDQPDNANLYAAYVRGGRKKRESPSPDQPDDANLYAGYVWGGRKKRESPSPDQPDDANLYAGYVWGGRKKRESPSPDQPDDANLYAGYVWGGRKKRESPSPDQPDDANLYAGYVWGGRKKRESPSPDQPDDANLYAGYVWGGRKKREYNGEELANLENTLGENVSNEKIYQEKMAANYFKLLKKEWNNMPLSAAEEVYFAEWDREEVVRISALGIVCFSDLEKTLDTVLRHLVVDQSKW